MAFYLKNKDGKMWKVAGGGGITEIPIATENILGGIKSSSNKGYISVDETTALATVNDNVIMEGSGEIVLEGDFGEGPYIITIDKNPPPSSGIGYDNSKSGIDAHTVQDAIDVNAESIKELQTKNTTQDTEISELDTKVSTNTESISTLAEKTTTNSNNITVVQNRIQYYSNRNLLDNWYFIDPINQRGQTTYSGLGYNIDRWTNINNSTILLDSDGLSISNDGTSGQFLLCQYIENYQQYIGKTLTLSFLVKEASTNYRIVAWYDGNSGQFNYDKLCTDVGLQYLTFTLPSSATRLRVLISRSSDTATSLKIQAAKLELGYQQTLAHQDSDGNWILNNAPPNYADELLKCQRYMVIFKYSDGSDNSIGWAKMDTGGLMCFIYLPVPMRISPSISATDSNNSCRFVFNNFSGNPTSVAMLGSLIARNISPTLLRCIASSIKTTSGDTLTIANGSMGYLDMNVGSNKILILDANV